MFTEVVYEPMIITHHGQMRDSPGVVVMDYRDTGAPALLEFTLEIGNIKAVQPP